MGRPNPPRETKFSDVNGDREKLHILVQLTTNRIANHVCMHGHTYSKSMDQPGKVANPARGQLIRENEYFPVPVCG